jgi:hypothetical protein
LLTDFDPVPLRYRWDGLTPQKQRDYVEALADCGIAREAAARIGVSEQAVARARRRRDARAFDLACEAAQRIGARRIRSIAWERAIEGMVRRHYYHGELKSEEVVFDNRLLVYLLGQTAHLVEPPAEAQTVVEDWERWMEAIEQGLPRPVPAAEEDGKVGEPEEPRKEPEARSPFTGEEVWDEPDGWWTSFPPPAGFDDEEKGQPGEFGYKRRLSDAELAVIEAEEAEERAEAVARDSALRDLYFGFDGGAPDSIEAEVFSPREAETYGTSVQHRPESARPGAAGNVRPELPDPADAAHEAVPEPPRRGPRIRAL